MTARNDVRVRLPGCKQDRGAGGLLAALATVLALPVPVGGHAATGLPLPQASAVQPQGTLRLELLPLAQRASLPDSAIVTLINGRTATMAQLRQEHTLRMQRFAAARFLGSEWQRKVPLNQNSGKSPLPMPPVQFAAKDYTDFCTAAHATACVYFPAGVSSYVAYFPTWSFTPVPNMVFDFDPLITDAAVCSAGGGNMLNNAGCGYAYPVTVTPNFTPGNYTASATVGCSNAMFSHTYDPHGAVQIRYTGGAPIDTTNTPPPGLVCIVQVIPN